jgi:hypothetical protein
MTTKNVFNWFKSKTTQKTYEDLLQTFTQTWGLDLIYIPRTSASNTGPDLLFGDDPTKTYTDYYTIEMFIQSVDQFEGGELFSKFGLQVKKQAKLLMPNRAWKREVQGALLRPREGDLIWAPNFRALFEIKYVDEEYLFYDLGKGGADPTASETSFYGFQLTVEKFRYNDEVIDTGIQAITDTVNSLAYVYNFYLANTSNTGTYSIGETVYQGANSASANCTASVVEWNLPTATLQLKTVQGLFVPNVAIVGANSGASWILSSYDILDSVNHPLSDNDLIEVAANNYLNFQEDNPFGEP